MIARPDHELRWLLIPLAPLLVSAAGPVDAAFQVVDARGMPLQGAVIEIDRPAGGAPFTFPWRNAMAQRDQTFVPGTLIVPMGSTVAFPNLDNVRHSIYSFSKPARFKIDLYGRDQTRSQRFALSGTVAVGCNIHDQMRGYIRVVTTPFARQTDVNGLGRIPGIAAGATKVRIWHPRLRAPDNELILSATVLPSGTVRLVVPVR